MASRHPVKPLVRATAVPFSITRWFYGDEKIPRSLVWLLLAFGLASPIRAALRHEAMTSGTILALLAAMYAARLLFVDFVLTTFAKRR